MLDVLERLLRKVEDAAPLRWEVKRNEFRHLTADSQFLDTRAEIVVAARLARNGAQFSFGQPGISNPDIILPGAAAIEVTAKSPEGIQDFLECIENMLSSTPGTSVTVRLSSFPVRLQEQDLTVLLGRIQTIAQGVASNGEGGVCEETVTDTRNASPVVVQATVLPVPRLENGLRFSWEVDAGPLGPSLAGVERDVTSALSNPRKVSQAQSMPSVLLVDVARLGPGWIRAADQWAARLPALIPKSSAFIGLGVIATSLDSEDTEIALAPRPGASASERALVDATANALGLSPTP